jgi:Abnormal spindle-like microcephaly-assoc'd, ASPM-SPD-2-Hydin
MHRQTALPVLCLALATLTACGGGLAATNNSPNSPVPAPGTLTVSPATLNFGTVTVGKSKTMTGTLSAGSDVTVSSADWSGSGYSVSGVTFPATITADSSVSFGVTFTPQSAGSSTGSISFLSDASNSPASETLTGSGAQTSQHSVDLSWDPSSSQVAGYNIYRGTRAGGPYSRLNSALQASTSFTDGGVQSGLTYFYVARSVDFNSQESVPSNEVRAAIP